MKRPAIDQQITFLYTDDLAASSTFYENTLGLNLWLDQGSCRIYRVTGEALVGICQTGDGAKGTLQEKQTNVIFTIVTQAVDEWYAYLQERGITFEKPPQYNPKYRIYHCFLRDPNGYLIEIQRFDESPV